MKKAFFMLSLVALVFVSFAFTPAETVISDASLTSCDDIETTVSMEELFGSGKFYGCYSTTSVGSNVNYRLVPQNGGTIIVGTVNCSPAFITLVPFVEYDIFITTDSNIFDFELIWEICFLDSTPSMSLTPGTYNVGSIYVTC